MKYFYNYLFHLYHSFQIEFTIYRNVTETASIWCYLKKQNENLCIHVMSITTWLKIWFWIICMNTFVRIRARFSFRLVYTAVLGSSSSDFKFLDIITSKQIHKMKWYQIWQNHIYFDCIIVIKQVIKNLYFLQLCWNLC